MLPLSDVDATGELQRRYVAAVHERLAAGGPVADARTAWGSFVRATSGDVFADLPRSDPADAGSGAEPIDRVFANVLYYDFLLECLLDSFETHTGTVLENRDPRTDTDALGVALGDLHDHVLPPDRGRKRLAVRITREDLLAVHPDALGELYRRVVPRSARLALGEYYTPRAVADLVLGALPADVEDATVLDPGCGTGVFLTASIDRKRAAADDPAALVEEVTRSVAGIDASPVAVKGAKLAYCRALLTAVEAADVERLSVPVFLTDALGLAHDADLPPGRWNGGFDAVVGNPPWIPWGRLPGAVKDRWRGSHVDRLGLQPHEGSTALLGHSNDDISVTFAWVCIDRYLRKGGVSAFVLKRDAMRGPAGVVLRRLRVGDRPLALRRVHDLADLDPFPGVGANAAVYAFAADAEPAFPVPATVWSPGDGASTGDADGAPGETPDYGSGDRFRATATARETELVPLDPEDETTAWVRVDAERAALGTCAHEIRHGLKDDANAVFGLDRDDLAAVDADLVYPYLKSRHVRKYGLTGHDLRLVPQRRAGEDNEDRLRRAYPDTYAYLQDGREALVERSSSWLDRGPFYSVFGLGPYTWADYKVVWCRLGFKPDFAVVSTRTDPDLGERQVVPGDHYMFVATDDRRTAHFLCGLLNSAPYQRTLRTLASGGKASLSKSVVSELALPPVPDAAWADRLAAWTRRAHERVRDADPAAVDADTELARLQARIDGLVEEALADGRLGEP